MRIFAKGIVADVLTLKAGTDVIKIAYKFNADVHWQEINKLRVDMYRESMKQYPDTEKLGTMIIELFTIVFGKDCTEQIVHFFEGSFESMIKNLRPVFVYKVYPACDKARKRAIKDRKAKKK